jgi:2-amino-4-hydroxy-6-hydroxymethyldihydropteridine diphosphokinase
MARAFLGLGSNLGDRVGYLRDAVAALADLVAVSPVYESDPVGGPEGQGAYLNLVAVLDTPLAPRELLEVCRACETSAGRRREVRWGPRTLDVDVLWVDGQEVSEPDLEVPHPRLWERRFVVAPLADVAPDLATPERLAASEGEVRRLGTLDDLPRDERAAQ